MGFNQQTNKDNIFIRSVLVGLVNVLNNQIFYENILDNNTYDIVEVPFFPATTGDERFLQDYFLLWNDCIFPKTVDGNMDPIPRGIVKLNGFGIDTSGLTQRFERGEFTKSIDGKIETFSALINSLPLKMTYDIEIQADGLAEMYKITQAILETFYKVRIFNVSFRGFTVACQAQFPDDYQIEKIFEFSYPSERLIKMSFSIEIETYYPVIDEPNKGSANARDIMDGDANITQKRLSNADFDAVLRRRRGMAYFDGNDNLGSKLTSLRHASNKMDGIPVNKFNDSAEFNDYKNKGKIYLLTPKSNDVVFSKSLLELTWKFDGWIDKVNAYYSEDYGTSWVEFLRLYDASKESFLWNVPLFSSQIQAVVVYEKRVTEQAEIRLIVDASGSIYDYVIINPGQGYDDTAYIDIENEGTGADISLVVQNGKISALIIYNGGSGYTSSKETEIAIKIQSSSDTNIYDTTKDAFGNIGVITIK